MRRRQYLRAAGGGVAVLLAGCGGDGGDGGSTPTATPTDTPLPGPTGTPTPPPTAPPSPTEWPTQTPTATATVGSQAPEIEWAGPVSRLDTSSSAQDQQVEAYGRGGVLIGAADFRAWAHEGEVDIEAQLEVYDGNGDRVGLQRRTDRQLTSGSGYQVWTWGLSVDTTGWDPGTYEGQILIRDRIESVTSQLETFDVGLVQPLRGQQATLEEYDGPSTVTAGQPFEYSLVSRNRTNQDSSLVSPVSLSYDGSGWYQTESQVRVNLPAGETGVTDYGNAVLQEPGEYTYRIDDIDATWTVTAE